MESVVEVVRGAFVESRHLIHAVAVDAEGRIRAQTGDPTAVTYFRSAAKPFQALPLVQDCALERLEITDEELAVCCGSHAGEPRHLRVVQTLLRKAGVGAEALACGPHPPFSSTARRELAASGLEPGRLHNNCSGKHAGMLALARARGWKQAGYEQEAHPVQSRVLSEISRWVELPPMAIGSAADGCGVPCFAIPLHGMALAYAKLSAAARRGQEAPAMLVHAMLAHPEMVAGKGRLCTDLMRRGEGRIVAKLGAEGLYCVGVPGAELGIALKVADGAQRAIGPAILSILAQLDLISEDDLGALHHHAYPTVLNSRGDPVGQIRACIELRSPDGARTAG